MSFDGTRFQGGNAPLWLSSLLGCCGLLGLPITAMAQPVIPNLPNPNIPPVPPPSFPPLPQPLPPPEQLLRPPAVTPPPQPVLPEGTTTITVQQFNVVGSTVFKPEDFAKITAPFIGRPLTFSELLQVRSAITQLYVDRGYVTSAAFIPADQIIQGGTVTIRVLEGSVEAIQVKGLRHLKSKYIRDRLALATGTPLNLNRALEALQLLQLNPLIKSLSAELAAGNRPGSSILNVVVTEAKPYSAQVIVDNWQVPSVGSFQRGFQFNHGNVLGYGDGFYLSYFNADGRNQVSTSYTLPVNARNGTLGVSFDGAWSRIVEEPFDVLNIRGQLKQVGLTYRQPVLLSPRQELALGLTGSWLQTRTTFQPPDSPEFPFPAPGTDAEGRIRVSELQFFQEWTRRHHSSVFALRSEFNFGLDAFDATLNPIGPDARYFNWRGQAQWAKLLAPDTLLLLRSNLQIADRGLLPVKQCSTGGIYNLQGYRQDYLLTDNCFFAGAEVRFPILRVANQKGVLQIVPSIGVGKGWNSSGIPAFTSDFLATAGLGLRWQWADWAYARFDWGIPLTPVSRPGNSLQDQGIYFSVVLQPF